MIGFGLAGISVLSFADDKSIQSQVTYNDKDDKGLKAKEVSVKKVESSNQNNKIVQKESEAKNGMNDSKALNGNNEQDVKNEQYDKRLTLKF